MLKALHMVSVVVVISGVTSSIFKMHGKDKTRVNSLEAIVV